MSEKTRVAAPDWEALQQAYETLHDTVYELSASKLGVNTYRQTQARIMAAQELLALLDEHRERPDSREMVAPEKEV